MERTDIPFLSIKTLIRNVQPFHFISPLPPTTLPTNRVPQFLFLLSQAFPSHRVSGLVYSKPSLSSSCVSGVPDSMRRGAGGPRTVGGGGGGSSGRAGVMPSCKLQTVVYDILPSGGRCRKAVFGVWPSWSPAKPCGGQRAKELGRHALLAHF